ncbi:MAG: mechanosensitive ion channel family protein, partial [Rhodothermales bacterium]|nr:mechanosensitive ion channel family protein [Rhodothermales bacterium]
MRARFLSRILTPIVLGGVLLLVYALFALFDPAWEERVYQPYFEAAIYAALGVFVVRVTVFVLLEVVFRRVKGKQAPALLHALIALPLYIAVVALVLWFVFGTNLGGLLATSAVVTVVLGLALQETLGNFFAGISIQIEQPFQIGDTIRIDGLIGRVETFNWRTTSIRTIDNVVVVFPNSKIGAAALEVYSRTELNRRVLEFPAPYSERPERVIALVEEAVRSLALVSAERPPQVRVKSFADSSVTYATSRSAPSSNAATCWRATTASGRDRATARTVAPTSTTIVRGSAAATRPDRPATATSASTTATNRIATNALRRSLVSPN